MDEYCGLNPVFTFSDEKTCHHGEPIDSHERLRNFRKVLEKIADACTEEWSCYGYCPHIEAREALVRDNSLYNSTLTLGE
ncbi:MAG: hypothetical protein QQN63_06150 [Nitrosopumilus sp.]